MIDGRPKKKKNTVIKTTMAACFEVTNQDILSVLSAAWQSGPDWVMVSKYTVRALLIIKLYDTLRSTLFTIVINYEGVNNWGMLRLGVLPACILAKISGIRPCTALHCTALHCTALRYTALWFNIGVGRTGIWVFMTTSLEG
jgi:hypothetical protein